MIDLTIESMGTINGITTDSPFKGKHTYHKGISKTLVWKGQYECKGIGIICTPNLFSELANQYYTFGSNTAGLGYNKYESYTVNSMDTADTGKDNY